MGEVLLFYKWLYWKEGISGSEFRQEKMRDLFDIMDINGAVNQKELSEKRIRNLINKVRY